MHRGHWKQEWINSPRNRNEKLLFRKYREKSGSLKRSRYGLKWEKDQVDSQKPQEEHLKKRASQVGFLRKQTVRQISAMEGSLWFTPTEGKGRRQQCGEKEVECNTGPEAHWLTPQVPLDLGWLSRVPLG